ncbi:MAG: hypothetical protein DYG89_37105 [Caldilinea sp. CFX5]|nr:hypothetical protein [Caldilinea sp. CFX5]
MKQPPSNQSTSTSINRLSYPLHEQGYIHHWLVAGPQAIAVTDLSPFVSEQRQAPIAAAYHQPNDPITQSPAELTKLLLNDAHGEAQLLWRVVHCGEDHLLDYSGSYATCHYLRAWAYSELIAPTATTVTFTLSSNGPAALWLNGTLVHSHHDFPQRGSLSRHFTATLQPGRNTVLVTFTNVALRDCPYTLALQVTGGDPAALTVQIPTTLPVQRRQTLEQIFAAAYLDKAVYNREDELIVRWPADFKLGAEINLRLQTPTGRIYTESHPSVRGGSAVNLGKIYQRPDGLYWLTIMPAPTEYHEHGLRIQRHIPLIIANAKFAETTDGAYNERRLEALLDATGRASSVYSELAKMALGRWQQVKPGQITAALTPIHQRADGSVSDLVGLLGALQRYGAEPAFPTALKALIQQCALSFKYWRDEPGLDSSDYCTEASQILYHASQVLAGQLFMDQRFTNSNQTGHWHQTQGEIRALAWLRKRAQGGFQAWDSPPAFEQMVVALSHLADLAVNVEVAEMATVLLDKLFFTMALNSWRGIFGSTQGRAGGAILSGRLEATGGISRLLWGVGAFHEPIAGTVSLALAQGYELPPPLYEIGVTPVEEMWSQERHAGVLEAWCDGEEGVWEVNKVTYKTPDYMLCSAQDYQPGQAGAQQHLWQATLGLDAVVFVNHPACLNQSPAQQPNFWRGNDNLPRVAQWKDILVALYNLPSTVRLGFTHAYFPTASFDEYRLRDGWAFARKGSAYLALTATAGLALTTSGDHAYGELHSVGQQNGWFCHLGRASLDGSFAEFQAKILALDITLAPLAVHATTLRGDSIDFGWTGPLLVNEIEQPLTAFHHYDSPFTRCDLGAETMEIRAWQGAMQLDFRQQTMDGE